MSRPDKDLAAAIDDVFAEIGTEQDLDVFDDLVAAVDDVFADRQQPEATLSVDFGEGQSELFKQLADRYLRGAVEARRDGTAHSDVDVLYPDVYEQDGSDDATVNELAWRTFGIDQLDQQRLDDADALDAICDNPGQHPEARILAAMRALNAICHMLASRNPDVPLNTHPAELESEWEQGLQGCRILCHRAVSDCLQAVSF